VTAATVPNQTAIAVDELHPNPWNRKKFDKQKLDELKASIEKVGVLQAIVVRPWGENLQEYEIVAGERRWRATKLAGETHIPATIHALTDVEVVETLAIENSQREDVHPLEEAEHFRFLLDNGENYDVDAIAAKVGKSKSYVYQRLKLADLIPDARKAFEQDKLTAGHAILLARLQPKDQQAALKEMANAWGGDITTKELASWIDDQIHLELKKAPFNTKDEKLIQKAGSCSSCPKRSGFTPDLFPELKKRDVCTDRSCFNKKVQAHITQKIEAHKKKGIDLVKIAGDYGKKEKDVVARWDWRPAKKSDRGAQPAIVVTGPDRGKVIHVTVTKPKTSTQTPAAVADTQALGRQRDLETEVISERAQEFADQVVGIAKEIPLSDDLALFFARNFEAMDGWPGSGNRFYYCRHIKDVYASVVPMLPGEWTLDVDYQYDHPNPKDGDAARHSMALEVWLSRDAPQTEKDVEREVKKRLKAEQRKKKRAEASAKKKAKSPKSTKTGKARS